MQKLVFFCLDDHTFQKIKSVCINLKPGLEMVVEENTYRLLSFRPFVYH